LGVVIGFVVRAHLFPQYLTEAQIGVVALLISYGSIFAQVALMGFNHAAIRYFPYFRNRDLSHSGFLSLYLLVVAVGFLVFLVIYNLTGKYLVHSEEIETFSQYYHLCIPLTVGILIFTVMDNYNTILYNASTGVLLRELGLRLLVLLSITPLIYGLIDFDLFSKLYVGTYLVIALLMLSFIVWRGEFHLNFSFQDIERNMMRAMAGISIFGFLTGLTNVAVLQVNNILINEFYDEAQTGIFVTNFFFATLILLPSRGLNKIAPTVISDAFKKSDIESVNRIQYKSTINQQLIAVLLYVGLLINLPNIYQILPESFAIGSWVIILCGLANVIQMTGGISSAIIGFSRYYRINTYLSILQLVLLVGLNVLLLPKYGINGAAWATLIAMLILNILKFWIIKDKFSIQPYGKKHVIVMITALVCIGINVVLPKQDHFIVDIMFRSIPVALVYVTLNYLLKTSRQLNDNINKSLRILRIQQ
jgi:O-antigen/teichoic acid export membrane protein